MKKFNFRLEKIRRYKEQLEKDKKIRLAAEQAKLIKEQNKLVAIIETRNRYFSKYGIREKGKINVNLLILAKRYLDKLAGDVHEQNNLVNSAGKSVSKAQQELIDASKEKKKYEKLKAKYMANYNKEIIRLEGIELDEFGARKLNIAESII